MAIFMLLSGNVLIIAYFGLFFDIVTAFLGEFFLSFRILQLHFRLLFDFSFISVSACAFSFQIHNTQFVLSIVSAGTKPGMDCFCFVFSFSVGLPGQPLWLVFRIVLSAISLIFLFSSPLDNLGLTHTLLHVHIFVGFSIHQHFLLLLYVCSIFAWSFCSISFDLVGVINGVREFEILMWKSSRARD